MGLHLKCRMVSPPGSRRQGCVTGEVGHTGQQPGN